MSNSRDQWSNRGSRGRGRGRGDWNSGKGDGRGLYIGGSGGSGRGFGKHLVEPPTWNLGSSLDTIELDQQLLDKDSPVIERVKYAASYNWIDSDKPVIAVPGSPPLWVPLENQNEPLDQDQGTYYKDTNAARFPSYPTEPAIRSLFALRTPVQPEAIDIAACASTLGNLLRFSRSIPSIFRFDAELIGDTLFLVRRETSYNQIIEGVKGYGHTFPQAYTQWDSGLEMSISHQRIITYDFGGLQCLVRFGCDGYKAPYQKNKLTRIADESAPSMSSERLPAPGQKLVVEERGHEVNQEDIFDIKTRRDTNKIDMEDILPRLWVTQTPNFLEAYYCQPGMFQNPQIRNCKSEIEKWERDNSAALSKLYAILLRIRDVATDSDTRCVEVSWQGSGPLKITEPIPENGKVRRALPPDLMEKWEA